MRRSLFALLLALAVLGGIAAARPSTASAGTYCSPWAGTPTGYVYASGGYSCDYASGEASGSVTLFYKSNYDGLYHVAAQHYFDEWGYPRDSWTVSTNPGYDTSWFAKTCVYDNGNGYNRCASSVAVWI